MSSLDDKAIVIVLCAIAPTAIIGYIAFNQTSYILANNERQVHEHEVHEELDKVLSLVTDAETGARGFTITGKDDFLSPYLNAVPQVERHVQRLRNLIENEPEQLQRFEAMEPIINQRLERAENIIAIRKQKGFEAARDTISDGTGRRMMEQIRKLVREMRSAETAQIRGANPNETNTFRITQMAAILTAFALALVAINIFFLRLR